MSSPVIKEGDLVLHPNKPEWGPGKTLRVAGDLAYVYWRDRPDQQANKEIKPIRLSYIPLMKAASQSDAQLDHLPPFDAVKKQLSSKRPSMTAEKSVNLFRSYFPLAFNDTEYAARERDYKQAASNYAKEALGGDQIQQKLAQGNVASLSNAMLKATTMGQMNLLSPYELTALREGLAEKPAAASFFEAMDALLRCDEPNEALFESYCTALDGFPENTLRIRTWPIATVLPFLLAPERFVFIKPEPVKACAETLVWNINYQPTPNWTTYKCVLELNRWLREELLSEFKPRDFIDTQSYMWVISKYDGTE